MVAHTSTTRLRHDPDDALPGGHAPPIPLHLHSRILTDLCDPGASIVSVAGKYRIPADHLALWLTEPETRAKMLAIEAGGYAHTRMAASITLSSTVNVLHHIIQDYTSVREHARALLHASPPANPQSTLDRLRAAEYKSDRVRGFFPGEAILGGTSYLAQRLEVRRAETVRRAALHLYRLSRIVPVNDARLANASRNESPTISEPRASARAVEDRNVSVSEPAALPDGTASIIDQIAFSSRTAGVSERICSLEHATSSPREGTADASRDESPTISEPRATARAVEDRTAGVSDRMTSSTSPLPSQTVHPAGALPNLPLASSLIDDANSTASVSEQMTSSDSSLPSQTVHPAGALQDLHPASAPSADADSPPIPPIPADALLDEWGDPIPHPFTPPFFYRKMLAAHRAAASSSPPSTADPSPRAPPT